MRAVTTVLFLAVPLLGGCGDDQRDPEPAAVQRTETVTLNGCLGRDDTGTPLLWIVDEGGTPEAITDAISQSTSLNGSWAGTRQVALAGADAQMVQELLGRRGTVTGTLREAVATTGATDQQRLERGAEFRQMTVDRLEPADGPCALDRRYLEPQHK